MKEGEEGRIKGKRKRGSERKVAVHEIYECRTYGRKLYVQINKEVNQKIHFFMTWAPVTDKGLHVRQALKLILKRAKRREEEK